MIKIVKYNNTIKISGHADYAEYGKDIVCASVSSIITTIVNCIMNIDSNSITYQDDGNVIIITIIKENDVVVILLNTMFEMLKDLENQYKENIIIESEE